LPCRRFGWLSIDLVAHQVLAAAWLETGETQPPSSGLPAVATPPDSHEEDVVFIIGIDPHKGSHTAAVLDDQEALVGELHVTADR
jgi:hypothetical protein